jgi:hypothetical protein
LGLLIARPNRAPIVGGLALAQADIGAHKIERRPVLECSSGEGFTVEIPPWLGAAGLPLAGNGERGPLTSASVMISPLQLSDRRRAPGGSRRGYPGSWPLPRFCSTAIVTMMAVQVPSFCTHFVRYG